tara:strand:- start:1188 stop:1424 length:237 start_codon:yes stop_codon:yes gene_type:complete
MTQFSESTLNQIANAMVDDSIQYVLDNERFIKILNETIEASIRDRLGEVEEDVLHEVRDYIMERVSLYRHSNCQILSS